MRLRAIMAVAAAFSLTAATAPADSKDPKNPTCPLSPNWSTNRQMQFTVKVIDGAHVLTGEGAIDNGLLPRLQQALKSDADISEIWLRSPGGIAAVGNAAGTFIRKNYPTMITRIPAGWTCFSACNFMFMGGRARIVDPGGVFMVHMFTQVADREGVKADIQDDPDGAVDMIGEIEQDAALLASDDNDFLIRMGISRKLLTEIMYRQKALEGTGADKSTRRCLTQEEMTRYGVTNAS